MQKHESTSGRHSLNTFDVIRTMSGIRLRPTSSKLTPKRRLSLLNRILGSQSDFAAAELLFGSRTGR